MAITRASVRPQFHLHITLDNPIKVNKDTRKYLFTLNQLVKTEDKSEVVIAGPREARNPNLDRDQRIPITRARHVYNRDAETGN